MLADLLNYTKFADGLYISVFENNPGLSEAENMFSHILNAQHIWISRILGRQQVFERFQQHEAGKLREISEHNHKQFSDILAARDVEAAISYRQSTGEEFTGKISDILYHIVNHSTYHRAQVATLLKKNNISPPVTDYIVLKREGLL